MMARESSHRSLRRFAWAGGLAAALMLGHVGAVGAADEEESLDQSILRNIMEAIGLRGPGSEGIEYRERSPLVVPPSRDLPPPETEAAVPNPAWPSDLDVKRRKEIAEARKNRKPFSVEDEMRPLSREELDKGRTTRRATGPNSEMEKAINPSSPSELGYTGNIFSKMFSSFGVGSKEEVATFDREPPRTTLTDPPAGYRTPAPSQPYGLTKERQKTDVVDRAVGSAGVR